MANSGFPEASDSRLAELGRGVEYWTQRGDSSRVRRWLSRELDEQGVPRRLPPSAWWEVLDRLFGGLASGLDEDRTALRPYVEGLILAALRFARPGGTAVFEPEGPVPGRGDRLREWLGWLDSSSLDVVANWWFPRRGKRRGEPAAPPLPAFASADRPLAILRPDWSSQGDLLAIDQRDRGGVCRLELVGKGRRWLGPEWTTIGGTPAETTSQARWLHWSSSPFADVAEWSFRMGGLWVIRTAVLLRGRQMALLAEQVEGPASDVGMRLTLPPGIETRPAPNSRALVLRVTGQSGSARVYPIGLTDRDSSIDQGRLTHEDNAIVLRPHKTTRRAWLPLVVSWDPDLHRRAVRWQPLTVTERMRVCPPDVAFATRLGWGPGEGLVVYRSLARPASRAFLGHQSTARFLIGLFQSSGTITPLVQLT